MKIRRMKQDQRPITNRVEQLEGTVDVIISNLDKWLEGHAAELKAIREQLEATKVRLNELAGGGE